MEGYVRVLGSAHLGTIEATIELGAAYVAHGKLEHGIRLQQKVLASSDEILGKTHQWRFMAMSYLGTAYIRQNRVAEAIEVHTSALTDCESVLGPRHPRTLKLLRNLAEDLSCQSKWKEAIEFQEKALRGMQSTYGVDHRFTIEGLQKLEDFKRRMNERASTSKLENLTDERITQEATDVAPQFEAGPAETIEVTAKLNTAVTEQRQLNSLES
jgi:tetratricopeptide (TPR) repeat protein